MDPLILQRNGQPAGAQPADAARTPVPGSQTPVVAAGTAASTPVSAATRSAMAPAQGAPATAGEPGHGQTESGSGAEVDYRARAEELERRAAAAEDQARRLQGTLGEVQTWAQRAEAEQRLKAQEAEANRRRREIMEQAGRMPVRESNQFIEKEIAKLESDYQRQLQEREQMAQQEKMQLARQLATPLYIDELVRQHGLPPEAKERLMSFGDPDVAAKQLPWIKQEYDHIQNLQNQLNQLSRTQRSGYLQEQGLGMVGGTSAVQSGYDIPDNVDPDTRAMLILNELRAQRAQR
jgi:flagellar biosynthesis GTPase FlhF